MNRCINILTIARASPSRPRPSCTVWRACKGAGSGLGYDQTFKMPGDQFIHTHTVPPPSLSLKSRLICPWRCGGWRAVDHREAHHQIWIHSILNLQWHDVSFGSRKYYESRLTATFTSSWNINLQFVSKNESAEIAYFINETLLTSHLYRVKYTCRNLSNPFNHWSLISLINYAFITGLLL